MESSSRAKVVIVGAGAAGLQCATCLMQQHGLEPNDIVILEARDRIGGRIHSTTLPNSKHIVYDHGAAWVHGTGMEWQQDIAKAPKETINPIMSLLNTDGNVYEKIKLVFHGNPWLRPKSIAHKEEKLALYLNGELVTEPSSTIRNALDRHFTLLRGVSNICQGMYEQGLGRDTLSKSLLSALVRLESSFPSDTIKSLSGFYRHMLECWNGASASQLQLGEYMDDNDEGVVIQDEVYAAEGDFFGPHCTVKGGMKTILEPLLQNGVRDRIRFDEQVAKIINQDSCVMVETTCGTRISAEACVVTVSVGCLRDFVREGVFQPALSDSKLTALSYSKMNCYKKVLLTFDEIFWPLQTFIGLVLNDDDPSFQSPLGNYLLFDNLWACDGMPMIEAILFGDSGAWASGKTDKEIQHAVIDFMQRAMNLDDSIEHRCLACHVTRWEEDPFSKGAYSYTSLGSSAEHVEELTRPEFAGRLVVAGEGTVAEFEGSVHAALMSGVAASKSLRTILDRRSLQEQPAVA